MQSNLLSGGLQTHLYGYFTMKSLKLMVDDNEFGRDGDLLDHINDAIQILNANKFET